MPHQLHQIVWYGAATTVFGFAFWKGRAPERIAAAACAIASVLTPFAISHRWFDPQWGVLAVDVALLGVLVWLALATTRTWLLFISAFQLLNVVTHVAMLVDHSVAPLPYRRGLVIWSYLTLVPLVMGTWRVWRSGPHPER
ncbi:MAG TPA: hypothetical protein VFW47_07330 [Phenylobacterium sp.]|nr:hypothetical protein [Phenylobacterium sp.]